MTYLFSAGQNVGFVVTKVWWYALRVFVDKDDSRLKNKDAWLACSTQHRTLNGAKVIL